MGKETIVCLVLANGVIETMGNQFKTFFVWMASCVRVNLCGVKCKNRLAWLTRKVPEL
jgi:hypothetical protein